MQPGTLGVQRGHEQWDAEKTEKAARSSFGRFFCLFRVPIRSA
jgi:hypothetical protein